MKDVDAPIVPVALDGVWGSLFSFEKREIHLETAPSSAASRHGELRRADAAHGDRRLKCARRSRNCMAAAWPKRRERMQPLHRAFVQTARRIPFRFAMGDAANADA